MKKTPFYDVINDVIDIDAAQKLRNSASGTNVQNLNDVATADLEIYEKTPSMTSLMTSSTSVAQKLRHFANGTNVQNLNDVATVDLEIFELYISQQQERRRYKNNNLTVDRSYTCADYMLFQSCSHY